MKLAHIAPCFVLAAFLCTLAHAGNVVSGDCNALKAYINTPGVRDDDGHPHPGYAGWTLPRLEVVPNYSDPRNSANPGEFCFTATARPQFTTAPAISTLDWQPTGCNKCMCQFDRDRWMDGIRGHEQHHADDYKKLVDDANAKLKKQQKQRPLEVKACFLHFYPSHTRQDAIQAWDKQVATAMALTFDALKRRADRAGALYDKRAIGDDPQCDNCKPCGPTEVAQCNSCSTCNSRTGVCEARPGCVPPQTCCCLKYVINQQGCQVGTILKTDCDAMNMPNSVSAQCGFPCTDTADMCK